MSYKCKTFFRKTTLAGAVLQLQSEKRVGYKGWLESDAPSTECFWIGVSCKQVCGIVFSHTLENMKRDSFKNSIVWRWPVLAAN